MGAPSKIFFTVAICIALAGTWDARAFSLMGPFQPWMEETNDLRQPGDIGGPMCISNAYRWNVPKVTYGFDPSFIQFFGTNGEAAVESAIQTINHLPAASDITLTDYPFNTTESYDAAALLLLDLKSWTMSLLLEQMGLAQPTRYTYVLRQWDPIFIVDTNINQWPDWVFPDYISELNYDPQSLSATPYVNNVLYGAEITSYGNQHFLDPFPFDVALSYLDEYTAVADQELESGEFYTGLTYDDVGGLSYLFSTNNVAYENLLSDVSGIGTNSFVNGAWRPGINKICFVPQSVDPSGAFLPTTNYFTDTYLSNGVPMQQQLMRVTSQPDFLFSANDVAPSVPTVPYFTRTGTTNWLNNATANGNTNGAGPGVIQPPIQIVFNKLGVYYQSYETENLALESPSYLWASFDDTTNPAIIYPVPQSGTNQTAVHMLLRLPGSIESAIFDWKPTAISGAQFDMQSSPDLINWTTLFTVTNNSCSVTYVNYIPATGSQFFRLIPQ